MPEFEMWSSEGVAAGGREHLSRRGQPERGAQGLVMSTQRRFHRETTRELLGRVGGMENSRFGHKTGKFSMPTNYTLSFPQLFLTGEAFKAKLFSDAFTFN